MNTAKHLLLGLACALILPSCSKENDNDTITQQTLNYYYNIVTDLKTGEQTITKSVSYDILRNYNNQSATLNFYGIRLPDGKTYPYFTVGPVKWSYNNDWNDINASTVTTTSTTGITPIITDLVFDTKTKYFDNYNGTTYSNISYTVDNLYHVVSYPTTLIGWGVTTSKVEGSEHGYTVDNSVYTMEFDPEKKIGDLTITNFSVAPDNYINGVTIKGIPCDFNSNGGFIMGADQATATLVGIPESQTTPMPIKDLRLMLTRGQLQLSYTITADGTTYNVTCTD